ncbi:uncharacterized protein LOC105159039 [Sesamum indicum]|uniref:Uncharacterized protein LOC105159039 n=1 Tax=Sesamum indicum TaxID=4182 RepID=A0A6I9SUR9_SESIN|nr:uncharacterized protein LOC105159039 [Sesamum indicum]
MEHHTTTSRAEAERLLGIAEKLLRNKDFSGCRDFAILAQETEPLLEGCDQILAVAEVLLAADNKRLANNQPDWYSVLQVPQRTDEAELIKKQYRRLALLLHPDKNKFPFSDSAFRLVADSWAVLSDPAKKTAYDNEVVARFTKVDLVAMKKQQQQQQSNQQKKQQRPAEENSHDKLPVRRSSRSGGGDGGAAAGGVKVDKKTSGGSSGWSGSFWTACPYCYNLYEYSRAYEGCCLRCENENCKRAFTGTEILSMPPIVPGREAYYCCWGFFPMGFVAGNVEGGNGFPKWMPPMFGGGGPAAVPDHRGAPPENVRTPARAPAPAPAPAPKATAAPVSASSEKRKRGRPRKNF